MRESVGEIADDWNPRIKRAQIVRVAGHDEIGAGRHGGSPRKREVDAFIQSPAAQVNRAGASIEKLDPGLRRFAIRQITMVIHDFVDDDFIVERKAI